MKDLKEETTKDLVMRFNILNHEIDMMIMEHNEIVDELQRRFPKLKEDEDIKPRQKIKI